MDFESWFNFNLLVHVDLLVFLQQDINQPSVRSFLVL